MLYQLSHVRMIPTGLGDPADQDDARFRTVADPGGRANSHRRFAHHEDVTRRRLPHVQTLHGLAGDVSYHIEVLVEMQDGESGELSGRSRCCNTK